MQKFLAIYYAPAEVIGAMANVSPEDKAKGMIPWMEWKAKVGDAVVDFGAPLTPGERVDAAGEWTNSTKNVSGYSIVQAESLDAAKALFDGHPHISWGNGCAVEVYNFIAM